MPRNENANSGIPLWLKLLWSAWIAVWIPVYWRQYGAQNFLYFCDVGNLFITAGLWLESPLLISWQAVALLVFQSLYALDLIGAFLFSHHIFGGTEYMFDPHVHLLVRLLGLYHMAVPPLLLYGIHRLGYDQRALNFQTLTMWILVPVNFFWRPQYNVNWARGLGFEQHTMPAWLYLIAYLVAVPLLIYWPTHLVLLRWSSRRHK